MEKTKPKVGQFYWTDIAVDRPAELKEFYKDLFGWQEMAVPMKDGDEEYVDYAMAIDAETAGGGICHNKGENTGFAGQWIPYFYVDNPDETLEKSLKNGGTSLKVGKKKDGTVSYAIIRDPQGAIFGFGNMV